MILERKQTSDGIISGLQWKTRQNLRLVDTRETNLCVHNDLEYTSAVCRLMNFVLGSSVSAVVRALPSHQCGSGSIPGSDVVCGLSLLVLYSAPRGFSLGTPVFPSHQKLTFDLIWFDFLSPQLVEPLFSAKYTWDINKVIIVIIMIGAQVTFSLSVEDWKDIE